MQLSGDRKRQGKSDPPPVHGEEPFDEAFSSGKQDAREQSRSKSVTFSLPPPNYRSAPPFMGPPLDFYYSLERDETDSQPCWSPSPLVPPIMELWSSVECVEYGPNTDIENDLLGEDIPLQVSSDWLDVCDNDTDEKAVLINTSIDTPLKKSTEIEASADCSLDQSALEQTATAKAIVDVDSNLQTAFEKITVESTLENIDSPLEKAVATKATADDSPHDEVDSPHDEVNLPDDEYFDEILNCDGDFDDSVADQHDPVTEKVTPVVDADDVNNRHRSSWRSAYNMTYKPPPPHLSFDPARYLSGELLHMRFRAAASIQSCVRAHLERQRFAKLLRSALVIQPFIRSFLFRQRLSTHLKLKSTYTRHKWRKRMEKLQ
eukprot:scaffold2310_cov126-Skeletonema_dohrnii-CCMP3373.AAC.1